VPLLVGACRLYQGAHHVSDVVVSLLVVSAWLALVVRLVLVPRVSRSPERQPRPARGGSAPG
jgi:membrane-associated phospholipid phosphatase